MRLSGSSQASVNRYPTFLSPSLSQALVPLAAHSLVVPVSVQLRVLSLASLVSLHLSSKFFLLLVRRQPVRSSTKPRRKFSATQALS